MNNTVITLDGPTSSGKTSVGYLFSQKIGFHYIDSGAIYRAGTIQLLEEKTPLDNEEKLAEVFAKLDLVFKEIDGIQHTILNGKDISEILHNPEISQVVPVISAYEKVREQATIMQRKVALTQNTVLAGRDIGTVIFPDAKLKFYLTADIQIRAQRRLIQLQSKIPNITYEEVLEQMIERDKADMIRKVSPLRIPNDAIVIDTSVFTTEQTVAKMIEEYKKVYK